jgi:hypothetical protein
LAFLAPDIQEAILEGRLGRVASLGGAPVKIPLLWSEQRSLFGVAAALTRVPTQNPRANSEQYARFSEPLTEWMAESL